MHTNENILKEYFYEQLEVYTDYNFAFTYLNTILLYKSLFEGASKNRVKMSFEQFSQLLIKVSNLYLEQVEECEITSTRLRGYDASPIDRNNSEGFFGAITDAFFYDFLNNFISEDKALDLLAKLPVGPMAYTATLKYTLSHQQTLNYCQFVANSALMDVLPLALKCFLRQHQFCQKEDFINFANEAVAVMHQIAKVRKTLKINGLQFHNDTLLEEEILERIKSDAHKTIEDFYQKVAKFNNK